MSTRSGPHKVLLAFYALFTLAAGARALVQLTTQYDEAPVAYWLSLAAAVTYALGWYAIREASAGRTGFASVMLWIELAGVLTVGTPSIAGERWVPPAAGWAGYGIGYGLVPAGVPVARLLWPRRPEEDTPPQ